MILNYLKIALRNIRRHQSFAILNISGLAVALAACLIIFLVLQHEFSYDTYHKNASRIHHLVKKRATEEGEAYRTSIPFAATAVLKSAWPHISFTEVFSRPEAQVTIPDDAGGNGKKFLERSGIFYAEPQLFNVFDIKWLSGSPALLDNENEIVLNRSVAEKYFGNWETAIGKMIIVDNKFNLRVGGVIEDAPVNSDFPFSLLISYKTFLSNVKSFGYGGDMNSWGWAVSWHQVYAVLPENTNLALFNEQLDKIASRHYREDAPARTTYYFRPLSEIHFDTRFENNGDHVISKTSLYTLFLVGVLILTMACINFVNLSTALAVKRSKEVGVRKVLGGNRAQVRWQVLTETALVVMSASLIALLLAKIALPYLKHVVVVQQTLSLINTGSILFIAAIALVTVLLSGIYPAFVLSRFKPAEAIKNRIGSRQVGGISLRRILVVMQFAFSQLLIIATIIAVSQMSFIRNTDIGIDKDALLMLTGNTDSTSLARQPAFKNELLKIPGVQSVSFAYDAPVSDDIWVADFYFNGVETAPNFLANLKYGDEDYLKTFGMQLLAGRFYKQQPLELVVNETMIKKLGMKNAEEAIGKTIRINNSGPWYPIVGVVKDFKNTTLREEIPPTILLNMSRRQRLTAIKLDGANISNTERNIQAAWDKFYPEYVYNRRFLDETIDNFYREERQMSSMYMIYAILAILISCLGLFGLVSFMAVQKTKEVGIRKVLGASAGNIIYLFSKEFTLLVLLAFAIAAPVAWYMMSNWLQNFVFRIQIGAGVFVLAILASISIAWLTVGYKALRAATASPVKSLRTE